MAVRPSFKVQHLMYCGSVDDLARNRPLCTTTLNGVDYVFGISPGTAFPFEPDGFTLFARLFSTSDRIGDTRALSIVCSWLDSPTGEVEVWRRNLGPVTFRYPQGVLDLTWAFLNPEGEKTYRFPGSGRYVFKLGHEIDISPHWRVKAREYILLSEVQS